MPDQELSVLFADDNPDVRAFYLPQIQRIAPITLESCNSNEALEKIIKHQPALAILDDAMPPGPAARELIETVRENYPSIRTAYLIMTGNPEISAWASNHDVGILSKRLPEAIVGYGNITLAHHWPNVSRP